MLQMVVAGALFLGAHLGISSTRLRGRLVARIGEGAYLGLYSVLAVVTLVYLIWLYGELPRQPYLWLPSPGLYLVAKLVMPVAMVLFVGGFMVPNPTNVGQEKLLRDAAEPDLARGVTRITRHPFQWSVILWAASHMLANGDAVSVVFFLTFLLLSGIGSALLDRKKAASLGESWAPYAARTSNVPFVAILSGRNRLVMGELWLPLAAGLVVYAGVFWGHEWLSGVRIL